MKYKVIKPIDVIILHPVHFDVGKMLYSYAGDVEDGYVLVTEVDGQLPSFQVPNDAVKKVCGCNCGS